MWRQATLKSLSGAEPMTDCVQPQIVDGWVTGLRFIKTPRQQYIFLGKSACVMVRLPIAMGKTS